MGTKLKIIALVIGVLVISACSNGNTQPEEKVDETDYSTMDNNNMDEQMSPDTIFQLNDSTGSNELKIPPILEPDDDNKEVYTIRAQTGETEIFEGTKTNTYGYNGSFLGPMLRLQQGKTVKIRTINELDEETTFHWHGLEVAGDADGGPHKSIKPGDEELIEFPVTQEAATLWFHPHPEEKTAEQVYYGLAGLIYIEDDNSRSLELPSEYGENDFPLILQDRIFDENKQLIFNAAIMHDGTIGDTSLVNGTLNPKLTIKKEKVRLRLLNGSNARNYTLKLNTGDSFVQIGSDGGFLNEPVTMQEITLTPSERAEIIIDFSQLDTENKLALVNEDGSVLLPFKVSEEYGENSSIPEKMNNVSVSEEELNMPVTKKVELSGMMHHVTINGKTFDPERIDFIQEQGVTEVWEIYNKPDMMGGMIHPFHIHGSQFKILSRNGEKPPANEQGWKDSISIDPDETVKIAIQFKHTGVYMFHCHILEHEDNGMMGQIKVE